MVEIGEVYKEKSSGPMTEPWGTPTEHGLGGDYNKLIISVIYASLAFHSVCAHISVSTALACLSACLRGRARACVCVCVRAGCARMRALYKTSTCSSGESVRGSCRVNVVAGLIAAECERRRRRQ